MLAKIIITLLIVIGFFVSQPVLAQETSASVCNGIDPNDPYGLNCGKSTGLSDSDPRAVAGRIINVALSLLGVLATCLIIYAGFKWMTAGGNEDSAGEAKKILYSSVIGLLIILSAYSLSNFIFDRLSAATGTGENTSVTDTPPIIPTLD